MADVVTAINQVVFRAKDETGPGTQSVIANLRAIGAEFDPMLNAVNAAFAKIKLVFGSLAALMGAASITEWAKGVIEAAEKLKNFADQTGSSVEALSRLTNQARISGTDFATLQGLVLKLSAGMAGFEDQNSKTAKALEFLGISTRDPAEALQQIALKLNDYADGIGKAAIARDLFGRGGLAFLATLKTMAEMQDVVATVTKEQAEEAAKLEEGLRRLKVESTTLSDALLSSFVPAMNRIIDLFKTARGAGLGLFDSWNITRALTQDKDISAVFAQIASAQAELIKARAAVDEANQRQMGLWLPKLNQNLDDAQKKMNALVAIRDKFLLANPEANWDQNDRRLQQNRPTLDYSSAADDPRTTQLENLAKAMEKAALAAEHFGKIEEVYMTLRDPKMQRLNAEQQALARQATYWAQMADMIAAANKELADNAELERVRARLQADFSVEITKLVKANAEAAAKVEIDTIAAGQAEVRRQYDRGLIDFQSFWDAKTQAERAALDVQQNLIAADVQTQSQLVASLQKDVRDLEEMYDLDPSKFKNKADFDKAVYEIYKKLTPAAAELASKEAALNVIRQRGAEIGKGYVEELIAANGWLLKSNLALDQEIAQLGFENQAIGLTTEQIYNLKIARIEEMRANAALAGGSEELLTYYKDQIDRLKTLQGLALSGEAQQRALDWWKATFADLSRLGSDFIVGLFTRGTTSFRDLWKNFKDFALRAFADIAAKQIVANIALAIGLGGTAGAAAANGLSVGSGLGGIGNLLSGGGGLAGMAGGISGWMQGGGIFSGPLGSSIAESLGLASMGEAGITLSSLGVTLGTAIPALGAAAVLYSLFSKGGGPKGGGFGTTGIDLSTGALGSGSTYRLVTPNDADAQMQALAQANATSYLSLYRGLGGRGTGSATFTNAFDRDPNGTADSRTSFQVWQPGSATPVYQALDRGAGRSDQDLANAISLESRRAIFAALQATLGGVPKYISDLFQGIDAATASADTIDKIEVMASAIKAATDRFSGLRAQLEVMSGSDVTALVDALGGVQSFAQAMASLNQNFLTDAQRAGQAATDLNSGFEALGLSVPADHQAFLDLLSGLDLTTDAGRSTYAAVMALSGSFVTVKGTAEDAARAMADLTKAGQDFYLQHFASQQEVDANRWKSINQEWTKFGGKIMELTGGLFDHIPTTAIEIQKLRDALYGTSEGATLFDQIMVDVGQNIVDLNGSLKDTTTNAQAAATALDTMFGGANIGVGGLLSGAYGDAARIISQGQAAAQGSTKDFGGQLAAQMAYLQQQISDEATRWAAKFATGTTDWGDQMYHDALTGRLNTENDKLAKELGRYTVLTAQYDAKRAEQLVQLEQWYDEQTKALRGNAGALGLLQQTFQERWKAIVDGTATGVDGTLSQLDKLRLSILEWAQRLDQSNISPLDPLQRLAAARSTYLADLAGGRAGDVNALQNYQKDAQDYLNQARAIFNSSSEFVAIFSEVKDRSIELGLSTGSTASPIETVASAMPTSSPVTSQADTQAAAAAMTGEIRDLKETVAALLAHIAGDTAGIQDTMRSSADGAATKVVAALTVTRR